MPRPDTIALMVQIRVERTIAAPQERVFDWLADPRGLTAAPLVLRASFAKGWSAPEVGALREVIGAGMWFREEMTVVDAPNSYSYLIVRSFPPFDHDGGTLTLRPEGDGTHVDWVSSYSHPTRGGGKLLEAVSAPLLRASFRAVLAGCAKALEN